MTARERSVPTSILSGPQPPGTFGTEAEEKEPSTATVSGADHSTAKLNSERQRITTFKKKKDVLQLGVVRTQLIGPSVIVPRVESFFDERHIVFEFVGIQHSICLCDISCLFFQFSEFTSGQDALPTVRNSGSVHTLPKEQASTVQQILFRGVMTLSLLPVRPGLHSTDVGLF